MGSTAHQRPQPSLREQLVFRRDNRGNDRLCRLWPPRCPDDAAPCPPLHCAEISPPETRRALRTQIRRHEGLNSSIGPGGLAEAIDIQQQEYFAKLALFCCVFLEHVLKHG